MTLAIGDGCIVTKAPFYMGSDASGSAVWSASCVDGRSFAVMMSPDAVGSTKVLDCNVLAAVAGPCFQKMR